MYLQGNGSELNMTYWENRPAVLVIPGGSYTFISQREGEPIALKFAAEGYQAFVRITIRTRRIHDAEDAVEPCGSTPPRRRMVPGSERSP